MPKFVLLWTDAAIWLLVAGVVFFTAGRGSEDGAA